MKRLLIVLVVIIGCVAALGYYRGWYSFSTASENHFSLDKDKIEQDKEKSKEKLQGLQEKVEEKIGKSTDKATEKTTDRTNKEVSRP